MSIIRIFRDVETVTHFTVDWMLHDRCTYNCSYCPPANKSGTDSWLNLEKLDEFCISLEKHVAEINPTFKIHCLFTGGEPTVWKDFGQLFAKLHARGWPLTVNSNGSRTERWWKEYAKNFAHVILSYHTELVNDDEFIEKLRICQEVTRTTVNVMMNPKPEFFEKALAFAKRLKEEIPTVTINHYKIQHTFGLQNIDVPHYTAEQKEILRNTPDYFPVTNPEFLIVKNNLLVEKTTGEITGLDPLELLDTGRANFSGWDCYAGLEGIFIDARGDIMRGTCRVGGVMGNVLDPKNIQWARDPICCPRSWCGCVTDIMTSKTK